MRKSRPLVYGGRFARDFDKWATGRKAAQFEAKGSPNEVTNWDHVMNMYFLDNDITNVIVQARLASHTFAGQALNWWHAHQQLSPRARGFIRAITGMDPH